MKCNYSYDLNKVYDEIYKDSVKDTAGRGIKKIYSQNKGQNWRIAKATSY